MILCYRIEVIAPRKLILRKTKIETIKPVKKLDCLTALDIFRQIPIDTIGNEMYKTEILYGNFFLNANPKDERFDQRYNLTVQPWTPYLFELPDGSSDLRMTIKDFQPYPGTLGGFAGSLLVSGKRPGRLNLVFDNYIGERKAWSYLTKDYIAGLIKSGYNKVPRQNQTIASITAKRDTEKYSDDGKERLYDKETILVIKPNVIELRTGDLFGNPLVSDKIYKSICNLVK